MFIPLANLSAAKIIFLHLLIKAPIITNTPKNTILNIRNKGSSKIIFVSIGLVTRKLEMKKNRQANENNMKKNLKESMLLSSRSTPSSSSSS